MSIDWYNEGFPHIWLPYTQMKTATPLPVVATDGCRIRLADGRELIDGIASWWTACHGYNHPYIRACVEKQLAAMPHIMFGGLVHEPALRLARRLAAIAPTGLNRVFFADSGSIAVEVALKLALQYWRNAGKPGKDRFLCFRNGYHGDTLGAMSVSDPDRSMHKAFRNAVIKQYVVDIPADEYAFAEFDSLLAGVTNNIAGVIIEPLVQGAEGMRFHSADVLAEIYRIAKKHDALFIADEIATGFGRTGAMFACQEAGIAPDILCLGKALTGGTMTLAATLAQDAIYEAFLGDSHERAFMHGPTFMANPLACAAANASLDLFETPSLRAQRSNPDLDRRVADAPRDDGYNWKQCVERIEAQLREELAPCAKLPGVVEVRVKGAIGVVQLKDPDIQELRKKFVERGVWIRPIKDVVYLMPAFTITPEELRTLTTSIASVLRKN